MQARQPNLKVSGALVLMVQLVLVVILARPVAGAQADVALFHQELAPFGRWVEYAHYGPVWYPTKVSAHWRPYLDGRWVPTSEGWVFETSEPWGWATYHFGNWMPTSDFGWVWAPGSTWYPSTIVWRAGEDFIGWAPVPPPGFIPPPAFEPAGGFIPGTPFLELLTPPFWIFARAPNFLLGFGKSFIPAYSFLTCRCLAPFPALSTIFPRTFLLTNFYFPRFAPRAFFAFGPPFSSAAIFGGFDLHRINNFAENVSLRHLRNVLPPEAVFSRQPIIRSIFPSPVLAGQRFQMRPAPDIFVAERSLARPGVIPPPPNVPPLKVAIAQKPGTFHGKPQRPAVEIIRGTQIVGGKLPLQAELENRVLRPEFPRQRLAPAGAREELAPGRRTPETTRRARTGPQRKGTRLTPREEFLRRRLEFELLRQRFGLSRGFYRQQIPPQMGPGHGRGLSPVLPPITPGPVPRPGRAFIGIR